MVVDLAAAQFADLGRHGADPNSNPSVASGGPRSVVDAQQAQASKCAVGLQERATGAGLHADQRRAQQRTDVDTVLAQRKFVMMEQLPRLWPKVVDRI